MGEKGESSEVLEEIAECPETGRSPPPEEPAVQVDPVHLFRQLPGISDKLARRITKGLEVRSLEELELAAHDGRLKKLKGFGPRRVRAVKEVLAGRLSSV
jgi:DNA polymerase (family 10)